MLYDIVINVLLTTHATNLYTYIEKAFEITNTIIISNAYFDYWTTPLLEYYDY